MSLRTGNAVAPRPRRRASDVAVPDGFAIEQRDAADRAMYGFGVTGFAGLRVTNSGTDGRATAQLFIQ